MCWWQQIVNKLDNAFTHKYPSAVDGHHCVQGNEHRLIRPEYDLCKLMNLRDLEKLSRSGTFFSSPTFPRSGAIKKGNLPMWPEVSPRSIYGVSQGQLSFLKVSRSPQFAFVAALSWRYAAETSNRAVTWVSKSTLWDQWLRNGFAKLSYEQPSISQCPQDGVRHFSKAQYIFRGVVLRLQILKMRH